MFMDIYISLNGQIKDIVRYSYTMYVPDKKISTSTFCCLTTSCLLVCKL